MALLVSVLFILFCLFCLQVLCVTLSGTVTSLTTVECINLRAKLKFVSRSGASYAVSVWYRYAVERTRTTRHDRVLLSLASLLRVQNICDIGITIINTIINTRNTDNMSKQMQ